MVIQELLTRIGFAVDRNSMQVAVGALGHVKNKANAVRSGIMSASSQILAGFGMYKLAKAGLEAASSVESLRAEFEVMLKDGEKANKLFGDIRNMALHTPFNEIGLSKSAKILLAYGRTEKDIMSDLRKLGDIAGADTEKFQHLALVYGQIWAAGKLKGDDLRQLVNWGINPLKEYADKLGITYKEAQEEMRKGNISSQMVMDSFTRMTSEGGLFYGNLEKQSKTLLGHWNVFKGYWVQFLGEVVTQFMPAIEYVLNAMSQIDWHQWIPSIKEFADDVYRFVKNIDIDELIASFELLSAIIISIATKDLQIAFIGAMQNASKQTTRYINAMKNGWISFKGMVIMGARSIGAALKAAFGPIGLALMGIEAVSQGLSWAERKGKAMGEEENVNRAWGYMMKQMNSGDGKTASQIMEEQRSRVNKVKKQIEDLEAAARGGDKDAERRAMILRGDPSKKAKGQEGTLMNLQRMEDYMRVAYERNYGTEYKYADRSKNDFQEKMDALTTAIKDDTNATKANTEALKKTKPFNPAELARMRQTSQFQQELKDVVLASGAIQ